MVGGVTNQQPQDSQLTEEEEFLKRNTDCVYFLASPLTCKKGSECEYRHSDIARVNPRDCWYWLNGNCLNPKCAFRHPPLDGLLGAEVPIPVGPAVPQAPAKQGVACIFFQKGFCLKGHLCPFLHGPPNIVNNTAVHPVPPNNPVSKPSKVGSVGPAKSIQEQKLTQHENVQKLTKIPPVQLKNGGAVVEKKVYKPASVVPPTVVNGLPHSRSNHCVHKANNVSDNEGINGKDVDEYSREPTPGFDVLVDTELGDSEYYPDEEQFKRSSGHDFDMGRSVDYDVDHDVYHDQHDFGRTRYPRDESPDRFDRSDLRHRLSKRRDNNNNVGGLRSVIRREHPRDNNQHHHRRLDSGPLSNRLQGRIKIPGRVTSSGYEHGSRVEMEIDTRRQQRSRYSPGRPPHVSSNPIRFRDRINGRQKSQEIDDGQTLGKRKYPRTESQQSDDKVSFEGPKPLSEILKRKRGSVISSVNNEDNNSNENNHKEIKETPSGNRVNADNEANNVVNKVGPIDEDAMLDQELEAYDDHRDGEYDYEQIDGEDYNLEEGEEYMEERDETGKKVSEVYS